MSGISQQLVTRFWPNFKVRFLHFKGRFLVPSITDANCHGNICSVNICPGNNCPYQEYLSCYWSDFDQTLKVSSRDHFWQTPAVMVTFVQETFVLATLSISGISQLLLTRCWPNFKGKFLGTSRTDSNCHRDFGPGIIYFLATFVHVRNISAVSAPILTKL